MKLVKIKYKVIDDEKPIVLGAKSNVTYLVNSEFDLCDNTNYIDNYSRIFEIVIKNLGFYIFFAFCKECGIMVVERTNLRGNPLKKDDYEKYHFNG